MLVGVSSLCLLGLASPAAAQTGVSNRQFVSNLFYVAPLDAQEAIPGASQQIGQTAIDSANEIAKFVGFGISSVPIGSSSAGFSYARDPVTGELALKSRSFGPLFADRPLTNGRGVFSIGLNYQHSRTEYNQDFDTADGRAEGIPVFDNRVTFLTDQFKQFVTRRAFLVSTVDAVNVFASVGLNDRIDLGVSIPIVSVKLDGYQDESYDITRTFGAQTERGAFERAYRGVPVGVKNIPVAGNPATSQKASGIGDIVVRGKVALTNQRGGQGAAVGVDMSLPTGDEEELLGRGEFTARLLFIGSKALGERASVYGNGGYRFGNDNNEAQYVAGVDVSLLPKDRLTVAVSFLGRSLRDAASLTRYATVRRVSENLGRTEQGAPNPERSDVIIDRFVWDRATVNFNRLSTEFKVHLAGQWLATGAVLFPINETGLQPRPTPFVGVEWAGGR
jgi:outer membrane putative beta-barrel porin/alpha-amylase